MATAVSTDLAPRLVNLFAQAGLITQADSNNFSKQQEKKKDKGALSSLRNIMMTEIALPSSKPRKNDSAASSLSAQLNIVADLHEDELVEMLGIHKPPLEQMINRLEESGAVSGGALSSAVDEAESRGDDPYLWLVQQGLLSAAVLQRFFNAPQNTITQYGSLFLALFILQHNNVISEADMKSLQERVPASSPKETLAEVKKTVGLSSSELLERIQSGLRLPSVSLPDTEADKSLFDKFSAPLVRRKMFVPLYEDERTIGIAIADPLNMNIGVLIRWITGKWMHSYFAPTSDIIDRINEHYGTAEPSARKPSAAPPAYESANGSEGAEAAEPEEEVKEPAPKSKPKAAKKAAKKNGRKEKVGAVVAPPARVIKEVPVDTRSAVQLVTSIVERAMDPNIQATDIHLDPGRDSMVARFRIDGDMRTIAKIPPDMISPVTSRIKVLAGMDVTERRRPQDGHIMLEIDGRHVDLRVATVPTVFGEKVAIRILDSRRLMSGTAEIGFNDKQHDIVENLIRQPYGIILVTGPTGSGKTSTLYAALTELNEEKSHLVTIEDPVEYQLDGINQIQVDTHIGVTFSEGLRAILRQDPNVIMVGEIRDPDTAKTAIRAAMTGHIVFSTLHTNSALGAIQALSNLGASPYMVGSALIGIISQRLVRKLCPDCSKKKPVTKALASQLGMKYNTKLRLARAVGCDQCFGTGYRGRLGIFEVVEVSDALRQAILANESPGRIQEIADEEGRQSMLAAGLEKVKDGITSPEELIEKVMLDT